MLSVLGFRVLGEWFRVYDLGFKELGLRVQQRTARCFCVNCIVVLGKSQPESFGAANANDHLWLLPTLSS